MISSATCRLFIIASWFPSPQNGNNSNLLHQVLGRVAWGEAHASLLEILKCYVNVCMDNGYQKGRGTTSAAATTTATHLQETLNKQLRNVQISQNCVMKNSLILNYCSYWSSLSCLKHVFNKYKTHLKSLVLTLLFENIHPFQRNEPNSSLKKVSHTFLYVSF